MDDDMKDIYDEKLELEWLINIQTIEEWKMHWQMCCVTYMLYCVCNAFIEFASNYCLFTH